MENSSHQQEMAARQLVQIMSVNANDFIGDTVTKPQSVKPLREADCARPIPKTDFFIIGTAKCGSTTLAAALAGHPDCCHSAPKEPNFFSLNFELGWDWYRGTFAHYDGEQVVGEASVSYTHTPFRANAAPRIHQYNPDAKLICIVRHPYDRLVSGWKMATTGPGYLGYHQAMQGFEPYVLRMREVHPEGGSWDYPDFDWDAAKPAPGFTPIFLDSARYACQLANYRKLFPDEQIKVMFLEDLKANPKAELTSLCEFVGLDPERLPELQQDAVNRADQRRQARASSRFLVESPRMAGIRALIPKSLRPSLRYLLLRSRWGTKKKTYPEFGESPEFKRRLMRYLQQVSLPLLEQEGKPKDFWNFEVE